MISNQIHQKSKNLWREARLLGATIRFPKFTLPLEHHLEFCAGEFQLHGRFKSSYAQSFPATISATEGMNIGAISSDYYFQNAIQVLFTHCLRRPARLAEFKASLAAIENWLDRRLLGLQKFERDLYRSPKPRLLFGGRKF